MSGEIIVGPHNYEVLNWMDLVSGGDGRCKLCKLPRLMHKNDRMDEYAPFRFDGDNNRYFVAEFRRTNRGDYELEEN